MIFRKICIVLFISCFPVLAQQEGRRLALVIGNDSYTMAPLKNAVNDARAIDRALRGANFRTTLKENVSKVAMEQAVIDFIKALAPGDTAMFFYAGHALQIEHENVLVPVDFDGGNSIIEAKYKAFSLAMVFDALKRKQLKRSIVVVDACRSNPVVDAHSLEGGLAIPLNPGNETLVSYSTSPNSVATDNPDGKNSWFTEALAENIAQPSLSLSEVFERVSRRVQTATKGRQTPWVLGNLSGRFYFHPPADQKEEIEVTQFERWLQDAQKNEQRGNFEEATDLVRQILKNKPGGTLEAKAKQRLPYLIARTEARNLQDQGKLVDAAKKYEEALQADPFSVDSALQGATAYLLADQLTESIRLLRQMRIRGRSEESEKAAAVLKELAAVLPEAEKELTSGVPQPPPIRELFSDMQLGTPDWAAGKRYVQASPVDLSTWIQQLTPADPPPAPAAPTGETLTSAKTPAVQLHDHSYHLEVVGAGDTRDLIIRKVGGSANEDFGVLHLSSDRPGAVIHVNGEDIQAGQELRLPPGKYEVRAIEKGATVTTKVVEVTKAAPVQVKF